MQIQCPNCDNVCELDAEPEIGQHLICPFCGERFSYSDDDKERENERLLVISNSVQKKSSARRDAIMDDFWMMLWFMGMVLLLILFVADLIDGIKFSSEAKGWSDDLGKLWLFFVVRWLCRVLFAVSIFMIGNRLNKSRQP